MAPRQEQDQQPPLLQPRDRPADQRDELLRLAGQHGSRSLRSMPFTSRSRSSRAALSRRIGRRCFPSNCRMFGRFPSTRTTIRFTTISSSVGRSWTARALRELVDTLAPKPGAPLGELTMRMLRAIDEPISLREGNHQRREPDHGDPRASQRRLPGFHPIDDRYGPGAGNPGPLRERAHSPRCRKISGIHPDARRGASFCFRRTGGSDSTPPTIASSVEIS